MTNNVKNKKIYIDERFSIFLLNLTNELNLKYNRINNLLEKKQNFIKPSQTTYILLQLLNTDEGKKLIDSITEIEINN